MQWPMPQVPLTVNSHLNDPPEACALPPIDEADVRAGVEAAERRDARTGGVTWLAILSRAAQGECDLDGILLHHRDRPVHRQPVAA